MAGKDSPRQAPAAENRALTGFCRLVGRTPERTGKTPPVPGRPGPFALADRDNVETGTVCAVFTTEIPEQFTEFIRDVAPSIANLVKSQPPDVQERIWAKVTEVWKEFLNAEGRVPR